MGAGGRCGGRVSLVGGAPGGGGRCRATESAEPAARKAIRVRAGRRTPNPGPHRVLCTRPGRFRPCASDFSQDLEGRTRRAADGAAQVTGKVGVPLHQGLCGAARRSLALAPVGSPQDGGPQRGGCPTEGGGQARAAHVQRTGAGGLSQARATPGEGVTATGCRGPGHRRCWSFGPSSLEGREDVNAS